ncbi:MAG TPA: L,D-transpeptidase [Gemmatimonadaceae bacterium]|nr:L,D-transpeptidase [Gemmatimonadaceae bacterium]
MKTFLTALAASLVLAPAALAQVPTTPTTPAAPAPAPAPAPQSAKMSVHVVGASIDHGTRYFVAGQRISVAGTITPFVEGERVTVVLYRGKRIASRKKVTTKKSGNKGAFSVAFPVRKAGSYSVRAYHKASAGQQKATTKKVAFRAFVGKAGGGSHGAKVRLLQRSLARMGYVTSRGGRYDGATSCAVLAYRKVNGMGRNGFASKAVFLKALKGRGTFKLRYPRAGKHVEFDWSRQVLVLASGGRAQRIYHASSGKPSTPTVFGTFHFYRKQPGTNSHGMVYSNYFIRGYAIHGYASVPNYAASHGCIRVPIPNAVSIYRWVNLGNPIFVYR